MNRLLPCPTCSRHVRVGEPTCPFCDGAQPPGRAPAPIHRRADFHAKRLGRAALFVSSAALAGCGAATGLEPIDPALDAAVSVDAGMRDAGPSRLADAGHDAGGVIAAYGGPGLDAGADAGAPDAGSEDAGPDAGLDDAGRDAGEPVFPAYGGPSFFDGGIDGGSDAGPMSVPLYGGPGPVFPIDAGEAGDASTGQD